jgi:hypothetical protein
MHPDATRLPRPLLPGRGSSRSLHGQKPKADKGYQPVPGEETMRETTKAALITLTLGVLTVALATAAFSG